MTDLTLDDVVTHKELAEFLDISPQALSYYRIPSIEMGKQRLYLRPTVVEWLKEREGRRSVRPRKRPSDTQ